MKTVDVKVDVNSSAEITAADTCQNLLRLIKSLKGAMAELAEAHGLTSIQLFALHAISEAGAAGVAMGRLAQTLHCDASNITGIVDRLTALSLIVRQENPQDRRIKNLLLTKKGLLTVDRITTELPARLGCDRLDDNERLWLRTLVGKLSPDASI
jgi:DNA-binding MarR family transcriptional regulator